jgi:ribosomal protein L29
MIESWTLLYNFLKIEHFLNLYFKDDENSMGDLSMQDEMPASPRSHLSSHDSNQLSPRYQNRPSRLDTSEFRAQMERNLAEKQKDINQLEQVVTELNAELNLAQTKLTDLLHQQSHKQIAQSDEIDQWRRDQQYTVDESKSIIKTLR